MVRPPCFEKPNVKKGTWSAEEDAKILENVSKNGKGYWTSVPKRAGLRRCGKSCRIRWSDHLKPDHLKHDPSFTSKEEELIIKLHATIGSRWALIAQQLPGRSDEDVKNYWNAKLRKKLAGMGIDPVTHKPFSQILADYGNIGGLSKVGMRIGSLNKDLKNAILMKREAFSSPTLPKAPLTLPSPNMVSPKTEPNQDNFLFKHSNNINLSNNHSLDLIAQLQAIKFFTEASNYPLPILNNESKFSFSSPSLLSPPSSSSNSTCSSSAQEMLSPPPIAFNWNDFLLEDAFLPSDHHEAQGDAEVAGLLTQDLIPEKFVEGPKNDVVGDHAVLSKEVNNETSSCESSFVEALLARENEMLLEFPELLEEGFHY